MGCAVYVRIIETSNVITVDGDQVHDTLFAELVHCDLEVASLTACWCGFVREVVDDGLILLHAADAAPAQDLPRRRAQTCLQRER